MAPPAEHQGRLAASDRVELCWRAWIAPSPRAAVLVSHGLGEHSGRYAALGRELAARGFSVYALDHRGHGLSGGPRAYAERFGVLVSDFERFRAAIVDGLPSAVPAFLLGHSLGGLIAIRHLQAHPEAPWRGAVLSAPLLGVAKKAARWKVALSGLLSKHLPKLPISSEIDPSELSRDAAYVRSYREDPLVHDKITPRLFTELTAAIGAALDERDRIRPPVLVLSPGADTIVSEPDVVRFAESLPGDVLLRRYPGYRHESLNDTGREAVIADVVGWMEGKLGGA